MICGNVVDIDLSCTFAPGVDFTVIRLMLAIDAQRQWKVHEVDYSSVLLQGPLERKVYMTLPKTLVRMRPSKCAG